MDYYKMFVIMIIAGLLSGMNIFADKLSDIIYTVNDIWNSILMGGWILVLLGVFDKNQKILYIGIILVFCSMWCIRTQLFINKNQYLNSMIQHHQTAIHMSKQILGKNTDINNYAKIIIFNKSNEIEYMKQQIKDDNNV